MPVFADNSRAYFDYEILEKLEAGLVLTGPEVKSVKTGKCSIKGCYVKILNNEAWLVGAIVSPYQPGNPSASGENYDSQRNRKLLLKKSQLKYLIGKSQEKGLSLIPLKLFGSNNFIKLGIGIGRGKKKYDKRETIKKREFDRKQKQITG